MTWDAASSGAFILVLGLSVVSTILFSLALIFTRGSLFRKSAVLGAVTLLVQAVFLGFHFHYQGFPFLKGSFDTLQLTSFCILLSYLFLCRFYGFYSAGILLWPLILIFNILSGTHVVAEEFPGHFLQNPWAFIHLVFVFIAVAVFMVSFAIGLLYLVQEYRIKHKKIGGLLDRMPSLEDMEKIHYRSLYTGFVFFTIGIITGGGWSKSIFGVYVTNDVKQLLSFAVWIFFALFLNLRVTRGWVGRKGVLLSSIGFLGVLFLLLWAQH